MMTWTKIDIRPATPAMHAYLEKLAKVCGYENTVFIALTDAANMPEVVGVTENPDGFLRIAKGKVPMIVMRDDLTDGNWQSLIAHEFLHVLRWNVDEWVFGQLSEDKHEIYMRMVEEMMKPFTILMMVGGMMNIVWIEGDGDEGKSQEPG